jgi:hypothetical protein
METVGNWRRRQTVQPNFVIIKVNVYVRYVVKVLTQDSQHLFGGLFMLHSLLLHRCRITTVCVTQVSDVIGGKQVAKNGSTAIITELLTWL